MSAVSSRKAPDLRRIVFVIGSLAVGGTETQMVLLAKGLQRNGWRPSIFAIDGSGPLALELRDCGIDLVDGRYRNSPYRMIGYFRLLRSVWRLTALCLRYRPHVIHGLLPLTNFLAALVGRATAIPVIVTSKRGLGTHQDKRWYFRWLDRIANRLSDHVTTNATAIAVDTERRDGFAADRIKVIPNGLVFSRFDYDAETRIAMRSRLGLTAGQVAVVKVANLIPYKGHRDLIEAFEEVWSRYPDIKLFLAGDDRGVRDQLDRVISGYRSRDNIIFLGRSDDVPRLLTAMDIGVMSSHEEGLSNAAIEMLAAGLPVVATDVGGNGEALAGMINCHLVPARSPRSLAHGISSVVAGLQDDLGNRDARRELARTRYSVEMMVDAYDRLYRA